MDFRPSPQQQLQGQTLIASFVHAWTTSLNGDFRQNHDTHYFGSTSQEHIFSATHDRRSSLDQLIGFPA